MFFLKHFAICFRDWEEFGLTGIAGSASWNMYLWYLQCMHVSCITPQKYCSVLQYFQFQDGHLTWWVAPVETTSCIERLKVLGNLYIAAPNHGRVSQNVTDLQVAVLNKVYTIHIHLFCALVEPGKRKKAVCTNQQGIKLQEASNTEVSFSRR